jgi:hypothetical protein
MKTGIFVRGHDPVYEDWDFCQGTRSRFGKDKSGHVPDSVC